MSLRVALLVVTCNGLACGPIVPDDSGELYLSPYLQNVTPTSITVMWETTGVTVDFGENDRFDRQASDSEARTIHEVHLTGLDPATSYSYRVRFGDQMLPPASFTTAPPPGTPNWRMVVYGDNRSNPATHAHNVEQIMKLGQRGRAGADVRSVRPRSPHPDVSQRPHRGRPPGSARAPVACRLL